MQNSITTAPRAEKFLEHLLDQQLWRRLTKAIDSLKSCLTPPGALKLSGSTDLYRLRVGDYRIIYRITSSSSVRITHIAHRREVYRP